LKVSLVRYTETCISAVSTVVAGTPMEYGNAGFGSVHSISSGFRCPEWEGDYPWLLNDVVSMIGVWSIPIVS
jgi:hypothetical protein